MGWVFWNQTKCLTKRSTYSVFALVNEYVNAKSGMSDRMLAAEQEVERGASEAFVNVCSTSTPLLFCNFWIVVVLCKKRYEWVGSGVWTSHVPHAWRDRLDRWGWSPPCFTFINVSCLMYGRVMFHIWMSHVSYRDESCLVCERDISHVQRIHLAGWLAGVACRLVPHVWICYVSCMNESCSIYKWVMSRMRTSRVPRVNESRCRLAHWGRLLHH